MLGWFKKKPQSPNGPDYSEVDSREKALALHQKGELVRMYLFPIEFGGQEAEMNCVYVPEFAALLKGRFDNLVGDLLEDGKVSSYSAAPEYRGKSFVPCALVLEAKGEGGITERVEIW